MNRRQPLSAAACAVLIVPIMFDLASIAGSRIDTATDTCAAQWTTTSPRHLWSSGASDASATSQCSNCAEDGILARDPDARLSTMRTSWPNPSKRSATWEPMKPAPPVTTILGCSPRRQSSLHQIRVQSGPWPQPSDAQLVHLDIYRCALPDRRHPRPEAGPVVREFRGDRFVPDFAQRP